MWMEDDSNDLIAVSDLVDGEGDGHEVAGWVTEKEINKIIDLMHNNPDKIKQLRISNINEA
jgi:hypothetical protein